MNELNTNIFKNIPEQLPEEIFENLFKQDNIQIERIVSKGHSTPVGQWYDQSQDEWVLLLQGQAIIVYETEQQTVSLSAGDYLLIPAGVLHRVEWTSPDMDTIWLTVHIHKSHGAKK